MESLNTENAYLVHYSSNTLKRPRFQSRRQMDRELQNIHECRYKLMNNLLCCNVDMLGCNNLEIKLKKNKYEGWSHLVTLSLRLNHIRPKIWNTFMVSSVSKDGKIDGLRNKTGTAIKLKLIWNVKTGPSFWNILAHPQMEP